MTHMKKCTFILSLLAALLGGCAVAPADFGGRERGYNRGEGSYGDRDYNDGNYHHYSLREACGNRGAPCRNDDS